jgi:hypothetical protein
LLPDCLPPAACADIGPGTPGASGLSEAGAGFVAAGGTGASSGFGAAATADSGVVSADLSVTVKASFDACPGWELSSESDEAPESVADPDAAVDGLEAVPEGVDAPA